MEAGRCRQALAIALTTALVFTAVSAAAAAEPPTDPGSILEDGPRLGSEGSTIRLSPFRDGGSDGAVTARFVSVERPGSATPGVDYEPVDVTVEWADGDFNTSRMVEVVTFVDGDYEGEELAVLEITTTGGLNAPDTLSVGIRDAAIEPISPARFLDTRLEGVTIDGIAQGGGPIPAMEPVEIPITGRAGVPDGAAGVAVNATAVVPGVQGYVALYPCTADPPTASTLNYPAGVTTGNGSIIALSSTGSVCMYSRVETDITIDVTGFVPAGGPLEIVTPSRLVDTRLGGTTVDGLSVGDSAIAGGSVRRVQVAGRAGVPVDVTAVFVNVTAVDPTDRGHVAVYDCAVDRPSVSSLNHPMGRTTGNGAMSALSASGELCLFSRSTTDVVVDLTAWSTSNDDPVSSLGPYRLLDTRGLPAETDGGGRLRAGEVAEIRPFELPGIDIWIGFSNYLNITVINPAADGNVRVYPCTSFLPLVSTVNVAAGDIRNNNAIVPTGERICIRSSVDTDLVIDLFGAWGSADGE